MSKLVLIGCEGTKLVYRDEVGGKNKLITLANVEYDNGSVLLTIKGVTTKYAEVENIPIVEHALSVGRYGIKNDYLYLSNTFNTCKYSDRLIHMPYTHDYKSFRSSEYYVMSIF